MRICLLLIVLALQGWSQNASSKTPRGDSVESTWKSPGGMFNGRFWRTRDADQKLCFLLGYSNAVELLTVTASQGSFENYKALSKAFWARGLTVEEVSSALDQFYTIPENGPIGIGSAISVVSERSQGVDEAEVQKEINSLRARATKN